MLKPDPEHTIEYTFMNAKLKNSLININICFIANLYLKENTLSRIMHHLCFHNITNLLSLDKHFLFLLVHHAK